MSGSGPLEPSSLTQEAADWHARLRSESLSEVEEVRFRAWLAADPARRREFDELSALWDRLEGVAQSPEVLAERRAIAKGAARGHVSRRTMVGWALAAGVVGVAAFLSWHQTFAFDTYATGVGEQRTVPLADGSIITLNTSSRLRVRLGSAERNIELLRGQANFEVAKDPDRPFIVRSGASETRALGTEFDVYRRADDTVVTLIEGRVSVLPDAVGGKTGALVLGPGDQVSLSAHGKAPLRSAANLEQVSAWRDRKLVFSETPLAEAIAEANRYSRVIIELRAPKLADAKISGTFEVGRNEALAEGLEAYFDLHVEHVGENLILLTPANAR